VGSATMNCTIVWLSVFRTTTRGFPLRRSFDLAR